MASRLRVRQRHISCTLAAGVQYTRALLARIATGTPLIAFFCTGKLCAMHRGCIAHASVLSRAAAAEAAGRRCRVTLHIRLALRAAARAAVGVASR
jgi:hypothetical protein